MIHAPLSATSVLDESASIVRATATPWAGLLLLTSLPYRFLQAVFADRLLELGSNASQYGDTLHLTADLTCVAFLLSLWGRAVYARACRLTSASGAAPGRDAFRVPLAALGSYILVAAIAESVTYMLFITVAGIGLGAILSGMAIGTMELNEQPGVLAPLRSFKRYRKQTRIVLALAFVFLCGFVIALVNVTALSAAALSLVSTIGGWDAPRWHVLLSFSNRRFVLMVFAGAMLVIEPFWIAANVLLVRKAGVAENGDDLRVWFEELKHS